MLGEGKSAVEWSLSVGMGTRCGQRAAFLLSAENGSHSGGIDLKIRLASTPRVLLNSRTRT